MLKIAAVKTGAIGDLIQTTPALSALKHQHPQSEITLICGAEYAHVLKDHPSISGVLTFSSERLYSGLMPFETIRILLMLRGFDKTYIFHTDPKWHFLGKLAGAKCSVKEKGIRRHLWHLKTVDADNDFGYSFRPETRVCELPDKPYIAIAAGGGRNARRHTPQRIWDKQAELALKIAQETRYSVVLLGTDEDRLNVSHPKIFDYTGKTTLSDCFHIIDNAEHYIGCDSGLTHLAACTATPTTVLCGPTDPSEALPPDITNVITSPLPCAPCDRDGVPACGENSCMAKIDITEVLRIIQKKSSAHKDMQSL